uniref:Class II aldolase/adducin N-terminal domain-containing protein n=1 Tax=Panagrolaimus sp. ES5 TaxID=591445 RepID=A0AC34GQV3_9BILA
MQSVSAFDQDMTSELFVEIMKLFFKRETNCVIHTHSKYANLLAQLLGHDETFEISDQEMIKGIMNRRTRKNYSNIEILSVPIIENQPFEYMLLPQIKTILKQYPDASAILVRNHGLFVWGPSWQKTKIMLECYEYLFELACDMIKCSIPLVKSLKVN